VSKNDIKLLPVNLPRHQDVKVPELGVRDGVH